MPVRKYLPSAIAIASMLATPAFAADHAGAAVAAVGSEWTPRVRLRPLRMSLGSTNPMDWRGFYIGGVFDYTYGSADFSKSTQAPIAYNLREHDGGERMIAPSNWPVLGHGGSCRRRDSVALSAIISNIWLPTRTSCLASRPTTSQASLSLYRAECSRSRACRWIVWETSTRFRITGSGSMTRSQFWHVPGDGPAGPSGNFLPYAFVGLALGRANVNISRETTVVAAPRPPNVPSFSRHHRNERRVAVRRCRSAPASTFAVTPNIFLARRIRIRPVSVRSPGTTDRAQHGPRRRRLQVLEHTAGSAVVRQTRMPLANPLPDRRLRR